VGNFKVKATTISDKDNPDNDEIKLILNKPTKVNDELDTNQEDMDRLIQPYLSFDDDDEETKGDFEVNEEP
jgi:hypothetical protein